MKTFPIGKHVIGSGKAYIIAEVAQAHDGNLNFAHNFIDNVAATGVEAIKFQMHFAEEESTREEKFRVNFSKIDATRYDYWKRMGFSAEEWAGLAAHCKEKNLAFLCSPFSVKAVELLNRLDVPAFKVGSGEIETPDLLEAIVATRKPILLSSGMSSYAMTDRIVEFLKRRGIDFALFQCTTKYPTPLEEVGLNVLDEFRRRYDCPVGLSDHSANRDVALLAMEQGADLLEMHVALHKNAFGPDASSSLTCEDFAYLAVKRHEGLSLWDKVRMAPLKRTLAKNPIDKDKMAEELGPLYKVFRKSVALRASQKAGTILTPEMLTYKKPGNGIAPDEIDRVIGQKLATDFDAQDRVLRWEDLVSVSKAVGK